MKSRIVVFYGSNQLSYFDLCVKLFPYLSDQGLLRRFSGLNLSTGKLSFPFELAVAFGGGKNSGGVSHVVADNGRSHTDCFHSLAILFMPLFFPCLYSSIWN